MIGSDCLVGISCASSLLNLSSHPTPLIISASCEPWEQLYRKSPSSSLHHLLPSIRLTTIVVATPTTTARSNTCYCLDKIYINKKNMAKGRPLSLQTVELKVRMCCTGCERVVKNALLKLRGIDSVEVDLEMEKVTITGYIDRNKVLKEVRRSGKKAEFWPNPGLPLYFTSAANYFWDEESFRDTYNYWRHGYNGDKHGHVPVPRRGDDRVCNLFNDDDVNACHVM